MPGWVFGLRAEAQPGLFFHRPYRRRMSDVLALKPSELWLPGKGFVPSNIREAEKAVEDYDANLSLGKNEQTGDWVVLLKRPDGETVPIFGLGKELPSREVITERLYKSDVRRHGGKLALAMERRDAEHRRDQARAADNVNGEVAEAFVWAARQDGSHPSPRIFVPS
jgi:hypothetical protein